MDVRSERRTLIARGLAMAGILSIGLLPIVPPALSTEESGQMLFTSSALGSNGKSCSSCHVDGKGLDKIGDFNDAELKDIINACIRDTLHGKKLPVDAVELSALAGYIRIFQKP